MVTIVVLAVAIPMIFTEWLRPARAWPRVPGWISRVVFLTGIQAAVVLVAGGAWDRWMAGHAIVPGQELPLVAQVGIGYVLVTFVFYWWHRWRHEVPFLWRWLHQVHHSPARIEVVTSFYKHPVEVFANALLSSAVLYLVLGVSEVAAVMTVGVTGVAELVYHWNVRTPRWLGWFFQRPEMHCVHHERGRHRYNYSDLPVWDLLFGTFKNPRSFDGACGFETSRLRDLLRGRTPRERGEPS